MNNDKQIILRGKYEKTVNKEEECVKERLLYNDSEMTKKE